MGLELVFTDADARPPFSYGHIPLEHSIRGFFSAEIWEEGYEKTADLLTSLLDHTLISEHENRFRFAATDAPGNYIDVLCSPDSLRGSVAAAPCITSLSQRPTAIRRRQCAAS